MWRVKGALVERDFIDVLTLVNSSQKAPEMALAHFHFVSFS